MNNEVEIIDTTSRKNYSRDIKTHENQEMTQDLQKSDPPPLAMSGTASSQTIYDDNDKTSGGPSLTCMSGLVLALCIYIMR